MPSLEDIRERFAGDRYAAHSGIIIEEAREGYARCSMVIQPYHLNALNSVQGGVLFTLGDFAFAVASCCGEQKAVSLSNQISYMKPAKAGHRRSQSPFLRPPRLFLRCAHHRRTRHARRGHDRQWLHRRMIICNKKSVSRNRHGSCPPGYALFVIPINTLTTAKILR